MSVGILVIIGGCFAIVVALIKNEFFAADIYGGDVSDTPISKWAGKAGFIFVGLLLVIAGIALLLKDQ